jgi:hypothetical protein
MRMRKLFVALAVAGLVLAHRNPIRRSWPRWTFLFGLPLLLVGAAALSTYRALAPADRVLIIVRPIPPETRFVCFVAETEQGPQPLLWSLHKVGPFEMHPADGGVSDYRPDDPVRRDAFYAPVQWREALRYGLVTGDLNGRWRVRWLSREELHIRGRSWLLGGGEGQIDLTETPDAEVASEGFWDRIGLGPDKRHWLESVW